MILGSDPAQSLLPNNFCTSRSTFKKDAEVRTYSRESIIWFWCPFAFSQGVQPIRSIQIHTRGWVTPTNTSLTLSLFLLVSWRFSLQAKNNTVGIFHPSHLAPAQPSLRAKSPPCHAQGGTRALAVVLSAAWGREPWASLIFSAAPDWTDLCHTKIQLSQPASLNPPSWTNGCHRLTEQCISFCHGDLLHGDGEGYSPVLMRSTAKDMQTPSWGPQDPSKHTVVVRWGGSSSSWNPWIFTVKKSYYFYYTHKLPLWDAVVGVLDTFPRNTGNKTITIKFNNKSNSVVLLGPSLWEEIIHSLPLSYS